MDRPDLPRLYRDHLASLRQRYAGALEQNGLDALIVHSGRARPRSRFDDQDWPLVVTPMLAHWLPLVEDDAFLVVSATADPIVHRTPVTSYWNSEAPASGDHWLPALALTHDGIDGARQAARRGKVAFLGENPAVGAELGLDTDAANPAALIADLEQIRAHKTDYERTCIGLANAIAIRGHALLARRFADADRSELELHLAYLAETEQDSYQTPYGNIVAQGEHAAVLHHVHYDRARRGARTLLVDAGASVHGYASDVTRTWVKGSGAAVDVFAALVRGVETLQQELCAAVRPGLPYEDLHERAHHLLAAVLVDVGIARAGTGSDELVATETTRVFFPHGLGHSLGIQVHDVGCRTRPPRPNNPHLRTTVDIDPGHVLTIEPGCYFIPSLLERLRASPAAGLVDWALVDELVPLGGVRIEDDVAVTASGSVNLTRDNGPKGH